MNELEYNNSDPTKETFIGVDKIQEELAEYAHKQWSGWMEYLFNKCTLHEGTMIIPVWAVVRWQKQIKTSYKDLSEEEKISDRSEADGMLEILSRSEEIKKLKDLTEDLLLTLVKYGIKQSEDVIEALKGIT